MAGIYKLSEESCTLGPVTVKCNQIIYLAKIYGIMKFLKLLAFKTNLKPKMSSTFHIYMKL